jgi:hypothetical protein
MAVTQKSQAHTFFASKIETNAEGVMGIKIGTQSCHHIP